MLMAAKKLDADTLSLIINHVDPAYQSEEELCFRVASGSNAFHFLMTAVFGDTHENIAAVGLGF
jgi:hypothetical protein